MGHDVRGTDWQSLNARPRSRGPAEVETSREPRTGVTPVPTRP